MAIKVSSYYYTPHGVEIGGADSISVLPLHEVLIGYLQKHRIGHNPWENNDYYIEFTEVAGRSVSFVVYTTKGNYKHAEVTLTDLGKE